MSVIVIQFITLDGFVSDPDGSDGTPGGGWAFRHGREAVDGDKFGLGAVLEAGTLLFGRRTWERFAALWPPRDTPFAQRMNAARKLVVSRTLTDVSAWSGSRLVEGDLLAAVKDAPGDVIVVGSVSVVRALQAADAVDEYRLLTMPTVVGAGERLFADGFPVTHLATTSVEPVGPGFLAVYGRESQDSSRG